MLTFIRVKTRLLYGKGCTGKTVVQYSTVQKNIVQTRLLYDKWFTSKTIIQHCQAKTIVWQMFYKQYYLQHCTVQCSTTLSSQDYCITNVLQARLLYILVQFSAVQYCPDKNIVWQRPYKQPKLRLFHASPHNAHNDVPIKSGLTNIPIILLPSLQQSLLH